ncbi:PQQ-dependent sugar dehydrogenase [Roseiarcus sp.]|jgi:glucose/arabinose dehydrogenase|uniref:PQQ-dependent sugar dehydrogenase n=1 Tax=Roseiarcus sp. TaxID=1969460 RepID=UPI003D0AB239
MKICVASAVALTALIVGLGGARADENNLQTLESWHLTAPIDWPTIPQSGPKADAVREILKKITLPPGFHIDLYALVPDARHMAVGPQGVVTFVGTRKNKIWAVTDRSRAGVSEGIEVKEFAPTLAKKLPNGPCFSKDGFLYVVEQNRVLQYPAAEFFYESPDVGVSEVVPEGQLIPKSEESFNHTARECRIGPDNKLYIQLGQPYNVPPKDKVELDKKVGMGGIIRMDQDGKNREVYATGLRNPVGMDFNPKDKTLWSNDNQVDGMGDDIPPGEMNRIDKIGENFGFPWYGGGHTRTNEYKDETPPADIVFPEVEQVAHAADLGLSFYTGDMFPDKYKGAIFSTQHGSWNRTVPVGARVMVTFLKDDGHVAGPSIPFAEGWNDNGHYLGRPVDVQQYWDGSLLVSDDLVGAVYRIWYDGK